MLGDAPASAAVPAPAAEARGVLVDGTQVPLTLAGCAVTADVGVCDLATVQVQLTYQNDTRKDVPVVAALPCPEGWTLMGIAASYDGSTVHSQCVSTSGTVAAESSTTVVVPTRSPTGVVRVSLPFTVSVGTSITVSATYLAPLIADDTPAALRLTTQAGRFTLVFPADLIPAVSRPPQTEVAYSHVYTLLNQPTVDQVLRLHVTARLPNALRGEVKLLTARSPSQTGATQLEAQVDYHGDAAFELTATLPLPAAKEEASGSNGSDGLNASYCGGALTIEAGMQDTIEPLRLFTEDASTIGCTAVAATLTATSLEEKVGELVNTEYVFVVDSHHTSTSKVVADALALSLRALPESVRVNVALLRDGGHTLLYPAGSPQVRAVDLAAMSALVAEFNPQRPSAEGTSALLGTLVQLLPQRQRSVQALPSVGGYVRHVVLLSDGAAVAADMAPASLAAAAATVRAARSASRVSAVAITAAPTSAGQHGAAGLALLECLCQRGNGLFVEATCLSDTAGALVSVLAATAVPTLTELTLNFIGDGVQPALTRGQSLPAVPSGCAHTVYALAPLSGAAAAVSVHATGKIGDHVVEYMGTTATHETREEGVSPLVRTAATARVAALLVNGTPSDEEVAEMKRLSAATGVATPYTCHVLVRRDGAAPADMEEAGGVAALKVSSASYAATQTAADSAHCLVQLALLKRRWAAVLAHRLVAPPRAASASHGAPLAETAAGTVESFVQDIVAQDILSPVLAGPSAERVLRLQEPDGSFSLSAALASAVGVSLDVVEAAEPVGEAITPKKQMGASKKTLWATVVAVSFLESHAEPVAALGLRAATNHLHRESPNGEWKRWLDVANQVLQQGTIA